MKRNTFFLILAFFVLCGCGYTTHSLLPAGGSSIYIDNFANKIDVTRESTQREIYQAYRPGMEADITREVIDKFIFDGNLQVKEEDAADLRLKGALVNFEKKPLRYDANDNVIEFRVSVIADLELHSQKEGKLIWEEENFAGESTYRTTGQFAKSESVAIEEATEDLARRIVERTVENW